jgi:CubicO group peptidase (beta-lactamase class C family)
MDHRVEDGSQAAPARSATSASTRHASAISTANVEDAVRAHKITTLCVVRSGETVVAVGPQDKPLPIHSIRKSIISALFGRLIARGDVQLSATLADFDIDDSPGLTDQERTATLQHLLTASSGVYLPLHFDSSYDIFGNSPSEWPQRGSAVPGAKFHYNNWDFNILGEIYQRVSGVALFTAIDGIMAGPLGFRDWNPLEHTRLHYSYDPLGATARYPNHAMQLSARDMARFGQLYLNEGTWDGCEIVPPGWVRVSTQTRVETGLVSPFRSYGYLWWTSDGGDATDLPAGSYSAVGVGGQILSVIPSHQMVVVAQREELGTRMALPADIINAVLSR